MFVVIGIKEERYSTETTLLGVFTTQAQAQVVALKARCEFEDIEIIQTDVDQDVRLHGPSVFSQSPMW